MLGIDMYPEELQEKDEIFQKNRIFGVLF